MHQFIEDAIKGGWIPSWLDKKEIKSIEPDNVFGQRIKLVIYEYNDNNEITSKTWDSSIHIAEVLLDPKAWIAVGKTRGWHNETFHDNRPEHEIIMHIFLDHLIDGLSIEEALNKIK